MGAGGISVEHIAVPRGRGSESSYQHWYPAVQRGAKDWGFEAASLQQLDLVMDQQHSKHPQPVTLQIPFPAP